jgi:hypothetical protein
MACGLREPVKEKEKREQWKGQRKRKVCNQGTGNR